MSSWQVLLIIRFSMKDDVNVENTKFSVDTNKRSDIDHQSWIFFHELLICTIIFSCVLIWFFIAESNKCVDYLILNFIREIFSKCIFSSILRTACSLSRFQKTSDRRLLEINSGDRFETVMMKNRKVKYTEKFSNGISTQHFPCERKKNRF